MTDANVWIDLHLAGLLDEAFRLEITWCAPDVVVAEIRQPEGRHLVRHGLLEVELTGEQVAEAAETRIRRRSLSMQDAFALVLAKSHGMPLLTGDRHLRNIARKERIEVHGTLWLLDLMVREGIVSASRAVEALDAMIAAGSRLPRTGCAEYRRRWKAL